VSYTAFYGYVTDADTRSLSLSISSSICFSFSGANDVTIDRPTSTEKEMRVGHL